MRAISRLAPAPVQSSTGVHSCTVLVAKRDLASQSIRRLDRCRIGFCLVRLLRAVALDRGFAPVPPLVQTAGVPFASGRAVCGGSVWFGSDGLSPLTGASPPYPRLCRLRRFSLQAGFLPSPCAQRSEGAVTPRPAERGAGVQGAASAPCK